MLRSISSSSSSNVSSGGGVCMVSEEKVSGSRNVGGDRFNRGSSSSKVNSAGGAVFRISGEKGRFGFRNAGGERSRSSLKLIGFSLGFSVRTCVFCLRCFLNAFSISGKFFFAK